MQLYNILDDHHMGLTHCPGIYHINFRHLFFFPTLKNPCDSIAVDGRNPAHERYYFHVTGLIMEI